jgi:hypothetical protein
MTDFSTVAAAVGDPLVVVLGVFAIGILVAHLLFKKHPIGRAIQRVVFLIVLTIARYCTLSAAGIDRIAIRRRGPHDIKDRLVALGGLVSGRGAARRCGFSRQPARG